MMLPSEMEKQLEWLANAVCPPDAAGPGAVELGALSYIRRLLEDRPDLRALYHRAISSFVLPSLEPGTPEAVFHVRLLCESDPAFSEFFRVFQEHLKEGLFCDPRHGGNRDMGGWKLIGFPQPQRSEEPLRRPIPADPGTRAHFDVCLIGLGAAGGIVAQVLTEAGLDVVALEAGPGTVPYHQAQDEVAVIRNAAGPKFMAELPHLAGESQVHMSGPEHLMGNSMSNLAGGSSVHYAAHSWRFAPNDFLLRTSTLRHYNQESIPKGVLLEDWPVTYEEMEPWYDAVEYALGVSGVAGVLQDPTDPSRTIRNPQGDPFEGARRRDFPCGPLRSDFPIGELMTGAARRLGYHPFVGPAAVLSQPYKGRAACTYCGFCNGFICHNDAKSSTRVTVIERALGTGRLFLKSGARVTQLVVDGHGLVAQAIYKDPNGVERRVYARTFVLGAYTFENVRLLLLSQSDWFPNGLANDRGQVGNYFITRPYPKVRGYFPSRSLNRFEGPSAQRIVINDFNAGNSPTSHLPFIRGGHIYFANQLTPIDGVSSLPPGVPRWGAEWKAFVSKRFSHIATASIQPEVLPYVQNRLGLSRTRVDFDGFPTLEISFTLGDNEHRRIAFMQEKAAELLLEAGADEVWKPPVKRPGISGHDVGGTRMGVDPETSVVDPLGRCHSVDNLFVVGGSVLPSLPGFQPTETVQALAWRTAVHILDTWN